MMRKTIFIRGDARDFLKKSRKTLHAGISEQCSYLTGGISIVQQQFFGKFKAFPLEVFVEIFTGFELQQVGEIIGRQSGLPGTPAGRRQMTVAEAAGQDMLFEERFCPTDHFLVRFLPGNELTFVEAGAIIQQ